jgi:hypothetical protein
MVKQTLNHPGKHLINCSRSFKRAPQLASRTSAVTSSVPADDPPVPPRHRFGGWIAVQAYPKQPVNPPTSRTRSDWRRAPAGGTDADAHLSGGVAQVSAGSEQDDELGLTGC